MLPRCDPNVSVPLFADPPREAPEPPPVAARRHARPGRTRAGRETVSEDLPGFDPQAVRAKYLAERDRRLVPGRTDIRDLTNDERFASYRADPFTALVEREPLLEDVDAVIVGGGIAGILAASTSARRGWSASGSSTRRAAWEAPGTGTATRA